MDSSVILLVEDELLLRLLTTDVLTESGFAVVEAASADEALIILQARSDVHVLFTDADMPGTLDGLGLAQIVHERAPHVSILVGSGRIQPSAMELPPRARFIAKPYTPSALTKTIHVLTQASRAFRGSQAAAPEIGSLMQI